jgi:hypothetical protein
VTLLNASSNEQLGSAEAAALMARVRRARSSSAPLVDSRARSSLRGGRRSSTSAHALHDGNAEWKLDLRPRFGIAPNEAPRAARPVKLRAAQKRCTVLI